MGVVGNARTAGTYSNQADGAYPEVNDFLTSISLTKYSDKFLENGIEDIHKAQLLNYMGLLKAPKGILINFNVKNIFHEGQETFVNKYYEQLM